MNSADKKAMGIYVDSLYKLYKGSWRYNPATFKYMGADAGYQQGIRDSLEALKRAGLISEYTLPSPPPYGC